MGLGIANFESANRYFPTSGETKNFTLGTEVLVLQSMFQQIWDAARASLTSDKVRILEISDYNTCGLEGDDRKVGGRWHSLVKSEGVPNPNAAAGGSYGIGKMAPFACSDARTVLYSTKTQEETYQSDRSLSFISFSYSSILSR
jgi:hypothetical protein